MAAFIPGASPPLVKTATLFIKTSCDKKKMIAIYYNPPAVDRLSKSQICPYFSTYGFAGYDKIKPDSRDFPYFSHLQTRCF
jgi:hypothetical protein